MNFTAPTIILCEDQGNLKGSGRSVREFDLHSGLAATAPCLLGFGGHRLAAGVRLEPQRLEEFRERFDAVARRSAGAGAAPPHPDPGMRAGFRPCR